ncbi:transketolase, partial [candidate division WWE3 bacterium CG_4_9_14_3_um_filter_39_7]
MEAVNFTESQLTQKATQIRIDTIKSLVSAGSGHSAGSLGMIDVMTALYFGDVLTYDVSKPLWS